MKFHLILALLAACLAHAEQPICGASMISYLTYLKYPGTLDFDLHSDDAKQMTRLACQSFVLNLQRFGSDFQKLNFHTGVKGIFNLGNVSYLYVIYAMTWPPPPTTVAYDFSYDICFNGFRRLMQVCPSQGGILHRAAYSYELIPMMVSYQLHNILISLS
jgi:hypothetical protein